MRLLFLAGLDCGSLLNAVQRFNQRRIDFVFGDLAATVASRYAADTDMPIQPLTTRVDVLLAAKHLAAQLGQGDINLDEYSRQATYTYGEMIRDLLGLEEAHG